jgi:large subunit ribosomal protein L20
MPRSVNAVASRAKRKKILKLAKGSLDKNSVEKGLTYSYVGRKVKKRDYRALWIARINAALREEGMSYSKFIGAMKTKNIELNRKTLAYLAASNPEAFKAVVATVKG